ncbi:MAG: glycosyltransferase family 4 protein [candidate division SR1 bacterium]|nr:glycosyltransferase family 4 protein [candidate division SR1 bacterium]
MKIAILIDGWNPPVFGGGQVHVQYLSDLLVKNHDCKVDLFVRKLIGDDNKAYAKDETHLGGKLRIFRIGPMTRFFNTFGRITSLAFTTFFLFYKSLRENYDIIHAHAYVSGFPAKIVGFLLRIPVIYTVHGTMGLDAHRKGILAKIERWLICGIKYDLELSVSHRIFDYKNVNKNIMVMHNGVDVQKFESVSVNTKYPGINFLYVGRVDRQKGHKYLIEGLGMIDKSLLRERGFMFNFVGDGELLPEIKEMTHRLGLDDFIRFKGKIFGDELIEEYKKNTIFILPSLAEGQPLTVLEAFASKLPVIATDVGDNTYFIKNDENGYLVPSADAKALKNVVEKFLHLPISSYQHMGNNGYDLIVNNYTWDIVVGKIYEQYLSLIK